MSRAILIKLTAACCALVFGCVAYLFFSFGRPAADRVLTTKIISLKNISPGSYVEVEWNNRPVVIYRPDEKTKAELTALNPVVHGPSFPFRVNRVFVYERVGTHRGCAATYRAKDQNANVEGIMWFGGWIDLCHFGAWDKAGRSYIRKPESDNQAQLPNFVVPKWRFISDDEIELL